LKFGAYRAAIGAGLVAHFAAGQFVNLLTAEAVIWQLAMLAALDALADQWLAAENQTRTERPAIRRAPTDVPAHWRLGGQPC
jgi:hypothetical protein